MGEHHEGSESESPPMCLIVEGSVVAIVGSERGEQCSPGESEFG